MIWKKIETYVPGLPPTLTDHYRAQIQSKVDADLEEWKQLHNRMFAGATDGWTVHQMYAWSLIDYGNQLLFEFASADDQINCVFGTLCGTYLLHHIDLAWIYESIALLLWRGANPRLLCNKDLRSKDIERLLKHGVTEFGPLNDRADRIRTYLEGQRKILFDNTNLPDALIDLIMYF
jgi:hypothetical protein